LAKSHSSEHCSWLNGRTFAAGLEATIVSPYLEAVGSGHPQFMTAGFLFFVTPTSRGNCHVAYFHGRTDSGNAVVIINTFMSYTFVITSSEDQCQSARYQFW
jgi:hypothetical protein